MRLTEPRLSGHRGGLTSGNASALRATTALRPQVPCFSNAGLQAPHSPLQGSAARTCSTATPMHAACHPTLSSGRRRRLTLAAAAVPPALASAEIAAPPFLDAREGMRDEAGRLLLRNLTLAELEEWCESVGEAPARARHLYQVSQGLREAPARNRSQVGSLAHPGQEQGQCAAHLHSSGQARGVPSLS